MRVRTLLALGSVLLVVGGVWTAAVLPPSATRDAQRTAPVPALEDQAGLIAALRPPRRRVPVVAVLGVNAGSETTDYIVPYAVLRASGLAEVVALGTQAGPLRLMPALTLEPGSTITDFDAQHPEGADYVIVPALHDPADATARAWIRSQSQKGATIVGICAGARVLAGAGLLRDRNATTHWYELAGLRRDEPTVHWVRDRRYVADRGVVTTTGVTASVPVSLAIVEAIGGRGRAETVAEELGVDVWDARHDSAAFRLDRGHVLTAVRNTVTFWNHDTIGVPVAPGVDEIALALTADAYSRTYRSRALTVAHDRGLIATRRGLVLVPDDTPDDRLDGMLDAVPSEHPARALDTALVGIERRYGAPTASFVALQLEYPWRDR